MNFIKQKTFLILNMTYNTNYRNDCLRANDVNLFYILRNCFNLSVQAISHKIAEQKKTKTLFTNLELC